MRRLNVLALDVATRMGWAYGQLGGEPRAGSVRLATPKQVSNAGKGAARSIHYRALRQWIADFTTVNHVDLVVYETPIAGLLHGNTNGDTVRLLIGLTEHIEELVPHLEIDLREAGASEVRKYFIGTGRPPKGQAKPMTMARCRELGWAHSDDNAADALALWSYQCWCIDKSADVRGRACKSVS